MSPKLSIVSDCSVLRVLRERVPRGHDRHGGTQFADRLDHITGDASATGAEDDNRLDPLGVGQLVEIGSGHCDVAELVRQVPDRLSEVVGGHGLSRRRSARSPRPRREGRRHPALVQPRERDRPERHPGRARRRRLVLGREQDRRERGQRHRGRADAVLL